MRVKGLVWQSRSREEVVVENKLQSSRLNSIMYTANGKILPFGSATTIRQSTIGDAKQGFSWPGDSNGGEKGSESLENIVRIAMDDLTTWPQSKERRIKLRNQQLTAQLKNLNR